MSKPGMIITGAAGYLGSRLVETFQEQYDIFAIDRRLPQNNAAAERAGIRWYQVDIGHFEPLREAMNDIKAQTQVEQVLHLAGYYDFSGDDHPEYQRSNIDGMRNVVELSTMFNLKNFVFTSSVAACPFPSAGEAVTEDTPATAPPPYSQSKRAGEEMLRAYRDRLPSTIVRLAAIFTDWCEYEPLNVFLQTWFSGGWNARVVGGKGLWAIPYMHMRNLTSFFAGVVERSDRLEAAEVLQGSPSGAVTHIDLYRAATASYFGQARSAIHMPKPLAKIGISAREWLGRLTGNMPFERSWMAQYIDSQLTVDASRTHARLNWKPDPEFDILQRLPVIIANLQTSPEEWAMRHQQRKRHRASSPIQQHAKSFSTS